MHMVRQEVGFKETDRIVEVDPPLVHQEYTNITTNSSKVSSSPFLQTGIQPIM